MQQVTINGKTVQEGNRWYWVLEARLHGSNERVVICSKDGDIYFATKEQAEKSMREAGQGFAQEFCKTIEGVAPKSRAFVVDKNKMH